MLYRRALSGLQTSLNYSRLVGRLKTIKFVNVSMCLCLRMLSQHFLQCPLSHGVVATIDASCGKVDVWSIPLDGGGCCRPY